ncbi:MAG TPA: hydrogenase expression/formation protein HypE [Firmicutes bacterium]|nr:hydrogenase expression/formation protein HypE [Bacillota bacterium]
MSKLVHLAHGDGGALTRELISRVFTRHFDNRMLRRQEDAAVFSFPGGQVAMTTDSFIVDPIFFPGGNIGKLAVCGTVNDLAVMGARPVYLTAGFIIEEGFEVEHLEQIAVSMARTASAVGAEIVAADTKVAEKGAVDGIFINTTGIGFREERICLGADMVKPGDSVIVSGPVGNHGLVILASRMGITLNNGLVSDCDCLWPLIREIVGCYPVRFMRDATRGGLATVLNELAVASKLELILHEQKIPVCREVMELSQMLGVDPLYLANEGRFIAVVPEESASGLVERLNRFELGKGAAVIGRLQEGSGGVFLRTRFGGTRKLDFLTGQHIPRIC